MFKEIRPTFERSGRRGGGKERDATEGIVKKGDVWGTVQGAVPRQRDCGTCSTTLDTPEGVAIRRS